MALNEQVVLDIQSAQRQIDDLERQLNQLSKPIDVPVDVDTGNAEADFRKIAEALSISEEQARQMAGELKESISVSSRLDADLRQVAQSLGLSGKEASDFVRQMRRAEDAAEDTADATVRIGTRGVSAFSNLRGSVLNLVGAFTLFQGARAFISFASDSIEAASNLEESTSKAQVVFGSFFEDIEAFASTAPQALGLANSQALEFTGTFGNLFVALGLSQQAAADLAPEIVQLGADLASFNNLEVTEALDKLRAGLVGEAEPLRALGVNLTAATVNAKALELGLAGTTGEITEAAKVQARYALILEQTATAQGDFARTSDGIANRQRTLAGEFENTRAAVGEALLPAFEQLLDIAPQLISAIEDGIVPALATMSTAIGSVDTEPLTRVLANLPIAAERIAGVAGGLLESLGQFTLGGLQTAFGDIEGGFERIAAGVDELDKARISNEVTKSIQNLITTITLGREPIAALESVLADLSDVDLPIDVFTDLVDRLFVISGLGLEDAEALGRLSDQIRTMGEAAGFSEPEIEAMTAALERPGLVALADASVGDIIAQNLRGAGEAAEEATPLIIDMASSIEAIEQAFGDFSVEDSITPVVDLIGSLPDAMSGAAAALRTEEGEIEDDFGAFLGNLEDELGRRQAFADDIALLRSLGLEDLADTFAAEGLDAAGALADAVANPEEAARAEALLDQFAVDQANSFRDEFAREMEQALDLTIPINLTLAIQALSAIGLGGAAEAIGAGGAGPNVGGGVTVNNTQNFNSPTISDTDIQRANQAVNGIIAVN